MANRRSKNIVPRSERGEPASPRSRPPAVSVIKTPYLVDNGVGGLNHVCLVAGELGDTTPIWCIDMIWEGESRGLSSLPAGPAWAYTLAAARAWVEKTFQTRQQRLSQV